MGIPSLCTARAARPGAAPRGRAKTAQILLPCQLPCQRRQRLLSTQARQCVAACFIFRTAAGERSGLASCTNYT